MQQTSEAKSIKECIEARQANHDRLADMYKSDKNYNEKRAFPLDFYERTFLALFVKDVLKNAASERRDLGIKKVTFNNKSYYKWIIDHIGRYFAYSRADYESYQRAIQRGGQANQPGPLASYENLISIGAPDPIPLIIESSLNRFPRLQQKIKKKPKLVYKTDIIVGEMRQEPAYIIVVPPEHAMPASNTHLSLSNPDYFEEEGGLIAKLYSSEEEFKKEVRNALERNKLHVLKI